MSHDDHIPQTIHELAAAYRDKLPQEDQASLRTLAVLCDYMEPLQRLADQLTEPKTPEAVALNAAIQYALQAVLRVGRCLVIETANSNRA